MCCRPPTGRLVIELLMLRRSTPPSCAIFEETLVLTCLCLFPLHMSFRLESRNYHLACLQLSLTFISELWLTLRWVHCIAMHCHKTENCVVPVILSMHFCKDSTSSVLILPLQQQMHAWPLHLWILDTLQGTIIEESHESIPWIEMNVLYLLTGVVFSREIIGPLLSAGI